MARKLIYLMALTGVALVESGCQPNGWKDTDCDFQGLEDGIQQSCGDDNGGVENYEYDCCDKGSGGGGGGDDYGGGGIFNITFDEFSRAVTGNGYQAPDRSHYESFNRFAGSIGKISTKQEAAMALAQFLHESDGLRKMREEACQNTECPGQYRCECPGWCCNCEAPGQYYYGRGFIKLRCCGNYQLASRFIFGDERLVQNPDLVADDPTIGWSTAAWFWKTQVHDANGVQQGQFGASTRAINGAIECYGSGHPGPAVRFRIYGNVRAAFGLPGAGDPSGC